MYKLPCFVRILPSRLKRVAIWLCAVCAEMPTLATGRGLADGLRTRGKAGSITNFVCSGVINVVSVRPSVRKQPYVPYTVRRYSTRTGEEFTHTVLVLVLYGLSVICARYEYLYSNSRTVPNPAREKSYEYSYEYRTNTGRSIGIGGRRPSCLPSLLHACLPPCMHACLPPCMAVFLPVFLPALILYEYLLDCPIHDGGAALGMRTVLYCTALHVDTGALIFGRDAFGIRL